MQLPMSTSERCVENCVAEEVGDAGPPAAVVPTNKSTNSGKAASGLHSALPSACARVCALARPSAIHCRSCSAETGPYSRSSAPMILYMLTSVESLWRQQRKRVDRDVAEYSKRSHYPDQDPNPDWLQRA